MTDNKPERRRKVGPQTRVPCVFGGHAGSSNAGNVMYGAVARKIIPDCVEINAYKPWSSAQLENIKARHSHIIFAASNQLRFASSPALEQGHKVLAENIIKAGIPVVVLGLGLQAPIEGVGGKTAPPDTVRLMQVLSDHSIKIGVRGCATADVLDSMGVSNVEVIGCPSCFWHRTPEDNRRLSDPLESLNRRVAFNYTHPAKERKLVQFAMTHGFDLIGQGTERRFANGSAVAESDAWLDRLFDGGLVNRSDHDSWVAEHFHAFENVDDWLEHMERYAFSFGTRFHGNMVAMLAGVRALWVVHDLRTKELCDYLHLPSITLTDALGIDDINEFFDRADYDNHKRQYPKLYKTFYDFLEESDLSHNLPEPIV